MTPAQHVPVVIDRVLELLAPAVDAIAEPVLVDATCGLGGHGEAMLEKFDRARVIGIDRDPSALERARERLSRFGQRFVGVQAVYDEIEDVLAQCGVERVAGVLFDLGVSSMQLDQSDRGFSYARDTPLDMRMNPDDELTAAEVLNTYGADELTRVLRDYGEERFARRISQAVVAERERAVFTTSGRLVELIREAIPAAAQRTGGHPAKRTFQALRIEVNDELGAYRRALPAALELTNVGGRVVVLAYHSLEDRITKRAFATATTSTAPRGLPVVPPEYEPRFRLAIRGAEKASAQEIAENPRAKPLRLRAVERIAA